MAVTDIFLYCNHARRLRLCPRLEKLLYPELSRTHHSEKSTHGLFGGQVLTFGAFPRFDPKKRGWLGPGLKTLLKPRGF